MRVFIRTSGWAIWATRVARPIVPLVLLSVLFHYIGLLSSAVFVACVQLAIVLAIVSLFLGIVGYVKIWYSGDSGWRESSNGVFMGIVAILFVVGGIGYASQFPNINDVSTAVDTTPLWDGQSQSKLRESNLVDVQTFPLATTRQYKLDAETAFGFIDQLAVEEGWRKLGQSQSSAAELHQYYEAKTLIGFVDDVTISTRTTAKLVIVNMRSASRFGTSDLGTNSGRIEQFLLKLDEAVDGLPEPEETIDGLPESEETS